MEIWDLYDGDRQKTGKTMSKSEKFPEGNYYSLRIHLCLFNSKGEMLIQQRDHSKKHWPDLWDITLSGGSVAGENSTQALAREVKEELGLDLDLSNEKPVFTTINENAFYDYFIIEKDIDLKDIRFDDGEVQAVKWASESEILKKIKRKEFLLYYPSFIKMLFEIRKTKNVLQPEGKLII